MRKCRIGAAMPRGSWAPTFAPQVTRKPRTAEKDEAATQPMAYFPTMKGSLRSEPLRHYFHRDMAYLLEADPEVLTWTTQVDPMETDEGGIRPSFKAEHVGGTRLIHVTHRPPGEKRRAQYRAMQAHCRQQGLSFEVLSREELTAHKRLPASRDLFFFRPFEFPRELPVMVSALAAAQEVRTLGDILNGLGGAEGLWPQILSLTARGYIEVDMNEPLGPDMPVRCCKPTGHLG